MNRLLAILALALTATSPASAHAVLHDATPPVGSTAHAGLQELRLTFNEALETPFCKVRVSGADAKVVATKELKAVDGDAKTLVVTLAAPFGAGTYTVRWSAMGRDGHRTKGEYKFSVK